MTITIVQLLQIDFFIKYHVFFFQCEFDSESLLNLLEGIKLIQNIYYKKKY